MVRTSLQAFLLTQRSHRPTSTTDIMKALIFFFFFFAGVCVRHIFCGWEALSLHFDIPFACIPWFSLIGATYYCINSQPAKICAVGNIFKLFGMVYWPKLGGLWNMPGFSTGGPRAKSGPPTSLVWPFDHLWNIGKAQKVSVHLALKHIFVNFLWPSMKNSWEPPYAQVAFAHSPFAGRASISSPNTRTLCRIRC